MTKIPKGRIFQNKNFNIPWFSGIKLEELIGIEDPDKENKAPIVIYIKGEGLKWQQFYLDVCFGVWENWEEFEKEEDDHWYKNYGEDFRLKNQIIHTIDCIECQFKISFKNGIEFILRYTNPNEFDSDRELVINRTTTNKL